MLFRSQKNPNQIIQETRQGKQDINIKLHPNQNQNRRSGYRRRRTFKKSLGRRGRGQPSQEGNFNRNRRANTQGASRRRNQNSRGGPLRKRRGPRLFIRNLTRSVTNNDLKTLFEKIGPLKRCGINWNDLGESKGTANVQYQYEEDTYKAFQKFDNTNIKGVPIRIELKGVGVLLPEEGFSGYCTYAKVAFDMERLREFDPKGMEEYLRGRNVQEPPKKEGKKRKHEQKER